MQANATLTVLADGSDVDIEVVKSVSPTEASLGGEVQFTITNLGTTTATLIEIFESLPNGYQ